MGGEPRFFPADRTPGLFFRSLFGFGTVVVGIAAGARCIVWIFPKCYTILLLLTKAQAVRPEPELHGEGPEEGQGRRRYRLG
jgi:hypothetical protein